jgi:3-hydroxybutyryl-CoA dehydratase
MSNANGQTSLGHGYYLEDLSLGMDASVSKTITEATTVFKKRIAHGFLTGALFSTVLGTKLPGPGCIYLAQGLKFRAPVYIGDEVVATCRITAVDTEKSRVTLACDCSVNGKTVLEGEAMMMVDRKA